MRFLPILLGLAGIATSMTLLAPATANTARPDGAAIYKRCAACHLQTGAGVPGAFPPLASNVKSLVQSSAGRNYMSLAVIKGVTGPVTVDGKVYRGIMPAQASLDNAAVAAVLNHVLTRVANGGGKAFTAAEIDAARKTGAALNPAAVGKLRPVLAGK